MITLLIYYLISVIIAFIFISLNLMLFYTYTGEPVHIAPDWFVFIGISLLPIGNLVFAFVSWICFFHDWIIIKRQNKIVMNFINKRNS